LDLGPVFPLILDEYPVTQESGCRRLLPVNALATVYTTPLFHRLRYAEGGAIATENNLQVPDELLAEL
jgi:hypothetical protein